MEVKIYIDGACIGNPGPGGWAFVFLSENEKKELFGGEKLTTNNRMELTAAIKALEYCVSLKKNSFKLIRIFTDSTYVKDVKIYVKFIQKKILFCLTRNLLLMF